MRDEKQKDGLDALVQQLPRDVPTPAGLWHEIESRLSAEPSARERTLESQARRLPAEIMPPEHVWQGIAARLTSRRAQARRPRLALLAAAASLAGIVALAGILFTTPPFPQLRAVDGGIDAGNAPARVVSSRARPWIFSMPAVDPHIVAEFLRSLELVQNERRLIESEMETAPDNLLLRELWARAYTAELELNSTFERTIMTYQRGQGI